MPSQKSYLDDARTQEVLISWRGIWKDVTVTLNGNELGRFNDLSELKAGKIFTLPDGKPLSVHYENKFGGNVGLVILYDGRPVKGSSTDPEVALKSVFIIACFIGGINIILGILAEMGTSDTLRSMGAGFITLLAGLLIVGLGYLAWKKRSPAALWAIIGLLAVDAVLTLMLNMEAGTRFPVTGIGLKVLFIIQLARGFKAFRTLEEENRN